MVPRWAALAALKQPWQASAGVEPTGAVAAVLTRVATESRKTFLTIRLLRLVVTQRYAIAIGIMGRRAVNPLVPHPARLAKRAARRTHRLLLLPEGTPAGPLDPRCPALYQAAHESIRGPAAFPNPQFLHHRSHRSRQVHPSRPADSALRGALRPGDEGAGAGFDGYRAGARHHHQGADRATRLSRPRRPTLRAQPHRHAGTRRLRL